MKRKNRCLVFCCRKLPVFFWRMGTVLFAFMMPLVYVFAQEPDKITEIHIVTPSWAGQTNEDGSGLFSDIVRNAYKPAGIKDEI